MINVALIDEENEEDLENRINDFLKQISDGCLIDIKYSTSHFLTTDGEQIYSYSAMIIYKITQNRNY